MAFRVVDVAGITHALREFARAARILRAHCGILPVFALARHADVVQCFLSSYGYTYHTYGDGVVSTLRALPFLCIIGIVPIPNRHCLCARADSFFSCVPFADQTPARAGPVRTRYMLLRPARLPGTRLYRWMRHYTCGLSNGCSPACFVPCLYGLSRPESDVRIFATMKYNRILSTINKKRPPHA